LKEIDQIVSKLKWIDITAISLSHYGLLSNKKMGELFIEHIGDKNLEDANIPISMIATDILTGDKVVLDNGSVAEAIEASTSIPGIFKPFEKDLKMLVDGGVVENVPVRTIRDMGANFIIGVDLNAKHTYGKPNNILDVILNSFHFMMKQSAEIMTQDTDILIKPDLSNYDRSDMKHIDTLISIGYEDAKQTLKETFNSKLKTL
jgi:NTE family protein